MLVTFHSEAYADITMFGDVAVNLLKLMGLSGEVPSAIGAEDIPRAVTRLREALARQETVPSKKAGKDDGEDEREVSLDHRALPLLDLMRASAAAKCSVMWDSHPRPPY